MASTEERRRLVRRLLSRRGRGFAEQFGFPATNNPVSLFQLLGLSILLRDRPDYRRAVRAAQALRDRGWDTAMRMAQSPYEERFRVLRDIGSSRGGHKLAATFGDLAQAVVDRYGGDLRRLRTQAKRDPARERALLKELPGVDDVVVDVFFREVQGPWREIAPFADRRALSAARKLDLGGSAAELSTITGGTESEKIAWLVGALAKIDLDRGYDEVRSLARS